MTQVIRTVQIVDVAFDCSLDDSDWTENDRLETEYNLPHAYIGQVYELEVSNDADEEEIADELSEEITCQSGWCIKSIQFRHILK